MKQNKSSAALFFVTFALCFACNNSQPSKGVDQPPPPPPSSDPSTCKGNCEDVAEIQIIHTNGPGRLQLHPVEKTSLINAMKATPAATSDKLHIHADVVNGELQFSPEGKQDPSHVTGAESTISLSNGKTATPSLPVRLVASSPAAKLLQERTKQP